MVVVSCSTFALKTMEATEIISSATCKKHPEEARAQAGNNMLCAVQRVRSEYFLELIIWRGPGRAAVTTKQRHPRTFPHRRHRYNVAYRISLSRLSCFASLRFRNGECRLPPPSAGTTANDSIKTAEETPRIAVISWHEVTC
ncbi:hypothetical protein E2C01_084582 [Portunus trituberculatus]|uniref:Uncharacterized protein n=1 Tax=Portunus trituberculatus TaxID=210409 RepID=A0A5B7J9P1_PORTR|nr:hypothetical protein [Portunus trituberculatus]